MSLDELARGMATGQVTRRRALGMLAGAAAASVVGIRGAQAQPGCRQEGHPCEGNQVCCPGLVCRVTGPGNAERCAQPLPPEEPKKCFGKCSKKNPCPKGCECRRVFSGDKCKTSKDCPEGFWCNRWGKCVKRVCRTVKTTAA